MSFIYSRKLKNRIYVLADSKLSVLSSDEDWFVKRVGKDNYNNIKSLGIIKNVIINKNICVASAGVLEDYNELLKFIDVNDIKAVDEICKYALKIHVENGNRTDFIVSLSYYSDSKLYQIKNGFLSEVEFSWLGSSACFNEFQKIRHDENVIGQLTQNMDLEMKNEYAEQNIDFHSFKEAVNLHVDDMVGDNIIECIGNNGIFEYHELIATTVEKEHTVLPDGSVILFDDAVNGGYTYHVYQSCDYYKMYIYQLGKGIVFIPFVVNDKNYNHLRFPKIFNMSEQSFLKKHKIECVGIRMN